MVSNPPYSVSAFKNNARKYYTENDFDIYDKLTDQSSEIECLFIERTKQLLKDGGIAGIILPTSILDSTGINSITRELILQYFNVISIVELGVNTFLATKIKTVILFLQRKNNYEAINIKFLVNNLIVNARNITINSIEKPINKYIEHVWDGIEFGDYITLLQKQPNKIIKEHDIYKEYIKKLKGKYSVIIILY